VARGLLAHTIAHPENNSHSGRSGQIEVDLSASGFDLLHQFRLRVVPWWDFLHERLGRRAALATVLCQIGWIVRRHLLSLALLRGKCPDGYFMFAHNSPTSLRADKFILAIGIGRTGGRHPAPFGMNVTKALGSA